jgi:hypothetical protein
MSGQLHAPAALSPGKETPISIVEETGYTSELVWTLWRTEEEKGRGANVTAHHLVPRSKMVELYLHSPICLNGIVFSEKCIHNINELHG